MKSGTDRQTDRRQTDIPRTREALASKKGEKTQFMKYNMVFIFIFTWLYFQILFASKFFLFLIKIDKIL